MKPAAIGLSMHSGWGILVAVAGKPGAVQVIDRRRIEVIDSRAPGAKQPYHFAAELDPTAAEGHIAECAANSAGLAVQALRSAIESLGIRGYRVAAAAILLGSGRALPALPKILAAHPLIHTAEGEFFRDVVRQACRHLEIPATGFPQKALTSAGHPQRPLGPPWTTDHKNAALAAAMLLFP
jgi:hypothetical protein